MSEHDGLIQRMLGGGAIAHDYQAAGTSRNGWKKYFDEEPGLDRQAAMELVHSLWRAFHDRDIRLLAGPRLYRVGANEYSESPPEELDGVPTCSQVFALPGLPVVNIVEVFKVGTHNSRADSSMFVMEGLAEIAKISKFEIQYADAAGLHATFLNPVIPDQATDIAGIISEVNPDALEICALDLQQAGMKIPTQLGHADKPDFLEATIKYISKTGKFRLWWN